MEHFVRIVFEFKEALSHFLKECIGLPLFDDVGPCEKFAHKDGVVVSQFAGVTHVAFADVDYPLYKDIVRVSILL